MNRSFAVGWRQVFAAMVIMFCSGMVASTYGIIAVPLAAEFHSSRMMVMLAITAMSICTGIISPIVGGLMDRTPLRRIIAVGISGLVLGYFALSFVSSFTQVLIIFALFFAASQSMSGPIAGSVLLTRWFDRRRGTALGIAISGIAGGTIVFPLVIQFLFNHFAWREGLRVLSLILFVVTVPAVLMIVNRPEDRGLHPDGADGPSEAARTAAMTTPLSTGQILSDPAFWLLAAVVTTVLAGMMGMITNVVPMARDLGVNANAAALIVSVYAVTGFCAKFCFGAIADRINTRAMMLIVLALFASGMATLGVVALRLAATSSWMIFLGGGLVGFGGMMIPLQSFVTPRIFGQHVVGRATGLLSLVQLCGLLLMPPVFGVVYDKTGSYAAIFFAIAAAAVGIMLLVPKIRLHPRSLDDSNAQPSALATSERKLAP